MERPKAIFVMDSQAYDMVYGRDELCAIGERADVITPSFDGRNVIGKNALRDAELIFSGWGAPRMDSRFLDAAPNLKVVFYAAGAIDGWATPELFRRGVRVTTAVYANSVPVAEYTLATILFSLKHGWRLRRESRRERKFVERDQVPGNYHRTVGLLGLGTVGRLVAGLLRAFDLNVIVHDPYVTEADARTVGARKTSLAGLFAEADAVSIHAPERPETRGMVNQDLLASMKYGATLINTSRGSLISQDALVHVLSNRPDLQAVLDVTDPEPPTADCALFDLPNVILTPHIAGSAGQECRRLGQYMVQEFQRYLSGAPFKWEAEATPTDPPEDDSAVLIEKFIGRMPKIGVGS